MEKNLNPLYEFSIKSLFSSSKESIPQQIEKLKKMGMEAVNGKPRYKKWKEIQALRGLL